MYELLRAPSNPISCSENSVSKLLTPNCGLPLHNNPTLLFSEPPLCVKPSLPQICKSDSLPSIPCVTPSKPSCGTKGDTLIGLTPNNVLVGTCEKAKPVIPAPSNSLPKFEFEHKESGSKDEHNCGTKPPQCQPAPSTKPVIPAPSNSLPKFEFEHKESGSKDEHNCGTKPPQCQPAPVTPAPTTPAPTTPAPTTPAPTTPVVVTGSGYGTIV
jgi:hypothetical protein